MRIKTNHGFVKMLALLAALLLAVAGCSSSGGGGGATPTPTPDDPDDPASNLAAIALVATQSSINPDEVTTLTATAYSSNGDGLAGEVLAFTVDNPILGFVTSTATTRTDGTATVTFTARSNPGTVTVTAFSGSINATRAITILDQTSPSNIVLAVSATSVTVTNTATVTATVTDGSGAPVDNGTTVSFEVTNPTYGTITASAVTNAGTASATFTASSSPGVATISASSGGATDTIDITVSPVSAAEITFASVSQNPIAIRGTGSGDSADIVFDVKDVNGNPAQDIDVLFTMAGPGGEEYIEEDDATPYTQIVGTVNGVAEVTLHSGYEPGPVTIFATITTADGDIMAKTPVISIGGGVPTDRWLSVSADEWTLGGLVYDGIETEITAWLADRYGNFNVLDGHSVSFQSEPGVALYATNATADAYGTATVTVRTQSYPQDVVPEDWECDLIFSLTGGNYTPGGGGAVVAGIVDFSAGAGMGLPTGHPRDGVASVLVHTKGEEHFFDGSGGQALDGQYNLGETFTDTADDPFRDYDDDGLRDNGATSTPGTTYTAGTNPPEEYVDVADNSVWNGLNGIWDADKMIFRNPTFLVTGSPIINFDVPTFAVPDGGAVDVNILICDVNYNIMTPGSTVSITIDKGKVYGPGTTVDYEYINTPLAFGPDAYSHFLRLWFPVTIVDSDAGDADPDERASVDVEVSWVNPGEDTLVVTSSLIGTID